MLSGKDKTEQENMGKKTGFVLFLAIALAAIAYRFPISELYSESAAAYAWPLLVLASLFIAGLALWRMSHVQRKLTLLENSLHQFERHINERFDALPRQLGNEPFPQSPLVRHDLSHIKHALLPPADPLQDRFEFDAPTQDMNPDNRDNIVPFLRLVQDEDKEPSAKPKKYLSFDKNSFHLRLQPVIELQSRNTTGFTIVPGFTGKECDFVKLAAAKPEMGKSFSDASCDLQLIESTATLLNSFADQSDNIQFYLPLSGGILERPKAFADFLGHLKRNKSLANKLILGLDQSRISQMKRAAQNRLIDLSDQGFKLSLTDCRAIIDGCQQVTNGPFEMLQVSIDDLERLETSNAFSTDIAMLNSATKNRMKIVVSGVKSEFQVMQLLDWHVPLADGPFFSEPKLPAIGMTNTSPAKG